MRTMVDLICMNSKDFVDQMFELKISAMNCCVNIPVALVSVLLQVGDKDAVLKNLFDLVAYEMTQVTVDEYVCLFFYLRYYSRLIPKDEENFSAVVYCTQEFVCFES
jgi:hypothetical protein